MHVHYYHCWPPNCHSLGPQSLDFSIAFLLILPPPPPFPAGNFSSPVLFFSPSVMLQQPLMISDENVQKAESFAQFFMPTVGYGFVVGGWDWGLGKRKKIYHCKKPDAGCRLLGQIKGERNCSAPFNLITCVINTGSVRVLRHYHPHISGPPPFKDLPRICACC